MGAWHCRGPRRTRGTGRRGELANLLLILLAFLATSLGAILSRVSTCKCRAGASLDLVCKLGLAMVSALVNMALMFDVETNPGPGPPAHACRDPVSQGFPKLAAPPSHSLLTLLLTAPYPLLRRDVLEQESWAPRPGPSTSATPPTPWRGCLGAPPTPWAELPATSPPSPPPSPPSSSGSTPRQGRRGCWWCQGSPAPPRTSPGRR